MAASSGRVRRRRVERGIYLQPNGRYAVCVMADGRPRFRTLNAATLTQARTQREFLQTIGRLGALPASPRLTFADAAATVGVVVGGVRLADPRQQPLVLHRPR
jgi:hypothetical protein